MNPSSVPALSQSEIGNRQSEIPIPLPSIDVAVRPGTADDLAFIDGLQKLHTKAVGWMPTATLAGKLKLGHVLVAEEVASSEYGVARKDQAACSLATRYSSLATRPLGYLIGNDQYFKRDDVGIIYQMNVVPGRQRGLIGATLLKAQFERSAYGCKLYCCWCAQDLAANKFWEAMGFVPLAFRAGSEKKSRVHIFWQKRIRAGDAKTPWWFPSKTAGGSIREDRVVLPIPRGTHWSDAKPLIFPTAEASGPTEPKALPAPRATAKKAAVVEAPPIVKRNGLSFHIPQPGEVIVAPKSEKAAKVKVEKAKRVVDPRLASAARELRDRWLEQLNDAPLLSGGKYEVARQIESQSDVVGEIVDGEVVTTKLLAA